MTAKEHNKLLGIFMLVQGGLQAFGGIMVGLIYGGIGAFVMTNSRRSEEQAMGGIFIAMAFIVGILVLAFAAIALMAGWRLLKEKTSGRTWGIVASIISLLSFPLGTALGVYGLWFLFGEDGKRFYAGGDSVNNFPPPPPPNNWQ